MGKNAVFRRTLRSGAVLVGEILPNVASAAVGVWVKSGSRDEDPGREGAAHFLEHMVFKGTTARTARDIALSLETVGGYLEAFTTKESTCFYARSLAPQAVLSAEVLADLVSNPLLTEDDLRRERSVIMEEYHQVEDTPEELVGDLAMARLWPGDIMGVSILGTPASIEGMSRDWIEAYRRRSYRPENLVVGAVGNVDPDVLAAVLDAHLDPGTPGGEPLERRRPEESSAGVTWIEKDLSQLTVTLAGSAPPRETQESRATQLLVDILGGGMSSRLFQKLREDHGLVYSVQAYSEHFDDSGILGITLGVSPDNVERALHFLREELDKIMRFGPTEAELEAAQAMARGSIIMEGESLSQRMLALLGMEAEGRWYESTEEIVAKYDAVSLEDVRRAAAKHLEPERLHGVIVGPAHAGVRSFFRDLPMQVVES